MPTLPLTTEWPSTLPLPFIDYSGAPRHATLMTNAESPAYVRRSRFERSYNTLSVSFIFNESQYEAFESFVTDTLANGASQFILELRYPLNSALTEWAVRFEEGWESNFNDGVWTITAILELVNPVNF